jgi:hypothetical protein
MPAINYQRLVESIRSSRMMSKKDREYRVKCIQRFQGRDSPVNMIEQYARIVSRGLVAKEPRVHLNSFEAAYRPQVYAAAKWYNEEIQRQELARVFQKVTFDAYIRIGIAQVALASPADLAVRGYAATIASPLCSYISFDDFAWDGRANDLAQAEWVGNRFRLPLEVVRDMKSYGPDRKKLNPAFDGRYNAEGDLRAQALDLEPYYIDSEDWVELWQIYVRRHNKIVTLADEQLAGVSLAASGSPLRVQDWLGPPCGPYVYMMFNPVPDQALANGTLSSLMLLDEATNELYRKLIRQAKRQKKNTLVNTSAEKDNKTFLAANDGDMVPVDNAQGFQEVTRGGPDKVNNAFAMELRDIFNRAAGNLETMGGTSSQAKTLGQEKILDSNATASLADMQNETNRFAAQVCKNHLWYEWYHPTRNMDSIYSPPGAPHIQVPLRLAARDRHKIPFESLGLTVDPYSMAYRDPSSILQQLVGAITQVFVPLRPLMQQAGVSLNFERFAEMFAELSNRPEFAELLETVGPQMGGQGQDDGGTAPPATERSYNRINSSEATQPGQDMAARQALLGQDAGGGSTEGQAA